MFVRFRNNRIEKVSLPVKLDSADGLFQFLVSSIFLCLIISKLDRIQSY